MMEAFIFPMDGIMLSVALRPMASYRHLPEMARALIQVMADWLSMRR